MLLKTKNTNSYFVQGTQSRSNQEKKNTMHTLDEHENTQYKFVFVFSFSFNLCIYSDAMREYKYLSCMKLQLENNFDLVLLAPPPRRLEHLPFLFLFLFYYFTLNSTLLSDTLLTETAGALLGTLWELAGAPAKSARNPLSDQNITNASEMSSTQSEFQAPEKLLIQREML